MLAAKLGDAGRRTGIQYGFLCSDFREEIQLLVKTFRRFQGCFKTVVWDTSSVNTQLSSGEGGITWKRETVEQIFSQLCSVPELLKKSIFPLAL